MSKYLLTGLIVIALNANAADMITDSQAAQMAKSALKDALRMSKQLNDGGNANKDTAYKVQSEAITKLHDWPDDNNHRALFPYHSCSALLSDVQQQAANVIKPSKIWEAHIKKNWDADLADCKAAIKEPDMRLKNVQ